MEVRATVIFIGKVQGVFFRSNTQEKARQLGLKGWVRNRSDGTVEAVFEGEKELVNEIIDWCTSRQPYASVERADVKWSQSTGEFLDFEIRR